MKLQTFLDQNINCNIGFQNPKSFGWKIFALTFLAVLQMTAPARASDMNGAVGKPVSAEQLAGDKGTVFETQDADGPNEKPKALPGDSQDIDEEFGCVAVAGKQRVRRISPMDESFGLFLNDSEVFGYHPWTIWAKPIANTNLRTVTITLGTLDVGSVTVSMNERMHEVFSSGNLRVSCGVVHVFYDDGGFEWLKAHLRQQHPTGEDRQASVYRAMIEDAWNAKLKQIMEQPAVVEPSPEGNGNIAAR